jgi:hypothetical protein
VVLAFGPGVELEVFVVVDFVEAALVALEVPLGVRGLVDEDAFGGSLRIVLVEPALDEGEVFGGVFAAEDDGFGAAAVGEGVHARNGFAGFGGGTGGVVRVGGFGGGRGVGELIRFEILLRFHFGDLRKLRAQRRAAGRRAFCAFCGYCRRVMVCATREFVGKRLIQREKKNIDELL